MKTAGRLNGTRSKGWLGVALVFGAAMAVLAVTPASAGDGPKPAVTGSKPRGSIVFSTRKKEKCIEISETNTSVPRYENGSQTPGIFCFENKSKCDVEIEFHGASPFGKRHNLIPVTGYGGRACRLFKPELDPDGKNPKTSVYEFWWKVKDCSSAQCIYDGASAKMIVQP